MSDEETTEETNAQPTTELTDNDLNEVAGGMYYNPSIFKNVVTSTNTTSTVGGKTFTNKIGCDAKV